MSAATGLAALVDGAAVADSVDQGRWAHLGRTPIAVVSPGSATEIATLLRWAGREGVAVLPAGSGHGCDPVGEERDFVVLTAERLSGLEIYEPADLTFTAGAGTPSADLAERLGAHRQWLPFDPPGVASGTVGGLVAAGDSGPLGTGYGTLRNHVLGMSVVTGDGRVLRLGGRVVKNVAGFDLLKPMVGSRGRLAFITSVCMRAFPEPAVELELVLRAAGATELVPAALAVGTAPVLPVASVLESDGPSANGSSAHGASTNGPSTHQARLSVRLHGAEGTVEADRRTLERHVGQAFEVVRHGPRDPVDRKPAAAADSELVVSILPSRLAEALGAIDDLPVVRLTTDTYAARMRIELAGFPEEDIRAVRDRVEAWGGALAIRRAPLGVDRGVASRPNADERDLAEAVARVFDPRGVFRAGAS